MERDSKGFLTSILRILLLKMTLVVVKIQTGRSYSQILRFIHCFSDKIEKSWVFYMVLAVFWTFLGYLGKFRSFLGHFWFYFFCGKILLCAF